MLSRKNLGIWSTAAAALLGLLGAATPAQADELPKDSFADFTESLGVSTATALALEAKFDSLGAVDQHALLSSLATEPDSVFDLRAESEAITAVPATPAVKGDALTATTTRGYMAKDSQTAYMLGIPVQTFTNEFKYEATSTSVTRVLSCDGWHSGVGVSDSVNRSSYISSGRGTCSVIHHMSFVVKGSPITFNKQHLITTNGGKPSAYVATVRTV